MKELKFVGCSYDGRTEILSANTRSGKRTEMKWEANEAKLENFLFNSEGKYSDAPYHKTLTHKNGMRYLGFLLSEIWKGPTEDKPLKVTPKEALVWKPKSLTDNLSKARLNSPLNEQWQWWTLANSSSYAYDIMSKWISARAEAGLRPVRGTPPKNQTRPGKPCGPGGYMLNLYGLIRSQELVRPVGKDLVVSDTRHPTPRWCAKKEDVLVMSKADRIWDEMWKNQQLGGAIGRTDLRSADSLAAGYGSNSVKSLSAAQWLETL